MGDFEITLDENFDVFIRSLLEDPNDQDLVKNTWSDPPEIVPQSTPDIVIEDSVSPESFAPETPPHDVASTSVLYIDGGTPIQSEADHFRGVKRSPEAMSTVEIFDPSAVSQFIPPIPTFINSSPSSSSNPDLSPSSMFAANTPSPLSQEDIGVGNTTDKRQRRLAKNRESAHLFRQKRKAYVQGLEQQMASLQAQNAYLSNQIVSLCADNQRLTDEVAFLHNFIQTTTATAAAAAAAAAATSAPPLADVYSTTAPPAPMYSTLPLPSLVPAAPTRQQNSRRAGLALVVLLSVGLVFNFGGLPFFGQNPDLGNQVFNNNYIPTSPVYSGGHRGRILMSVNAEKTDLSTNHDIERSLQTNLGPEDKMIDRQQNLVVPDRIAAAASLDFRHPSDVGRIESVVPSGDKSATGGPLSSRDSYDVSRVESLVQAETQPTGVSAREAGDVARMENVVASLGAHTESSLLARDAGGVAPIEGVVMTEGLTGVSTRQAGTVSNVDGIVMTGSQGAHGLASREAGDVSRIEGVVSSHADQHSEVSARVSGDLARVDGLVTAGSDPSQERSVSARGAGEVSRVDGLVMPGVGQESGVAAREAGAVSRVDGLVTADVAEVGVAARGDGSVSRVEGVVESNSAPKAEEGLAARGAGDVALQEGLVAADVPQPSDVLLGNTERSVVWHDPARDDTQNVLARMLGLVLGFGRIPHPDGGVVATMLRDNNEIARQLGIVSSRDGSDAWNMDIATQTGVVTPDADSTSEAIETKSLSTVSHDDAKWIAHVLGMVAKVGWPIYELTAIARQVGLVNAGFPCEPIIEIKAVARLLGMVATSGRSYSDLTALAKQLGLVSVVPRNEWEDLKGVARLMGLVAKSGWTLDEFSAVARQLGLIPSNETETVGGGRTHDRLKGVVATRVADELKAVARLLGVVSKESIEASPGEFDKAVARLTGLVHLAGSASADVSPLPKQYELPGSVRMRGVKKGGAWKRMDEDVILQELDHLAAELEKRNDGEDRSYIYCTRAFQFNPKDRAGERKSSHLAAGKDSGDKTMSLLLPTRVLNNNTRPGKAGNMSVVEVRCDVIDVRQFLIPTPESDNPSPTPAVQRPPGAARM